MGVRAVQRARCYPFNMPKRRFHNMNPQVHHNLLCYSYAIDSHRYPLFILIWELGHQQVWNRYCAHSTPISICPGRPNGRPSGRVLVCRELCRPQLYFICLLRPKDGRSPTGRRYGEDDIAVQLMFYTESTAPLKCWTCHHVRWKLVEL